MVRGPAQTTDDALGVPAEPPAESPEGVPACPPAPPGRVTGVPPGSRVWSRPGCPALSAFPPAPPSTMLAAHGLGPAGGRAGPLIESLPAPPPPPAINWATPASLMSLAPPPAPPDWEPVPPA